MLTPFGKPTQSLFTTPTNLPWGRKVIMFGMYTKAQINTMITTEGYIPIATADELNALRNATAQTFGAGSKWEGTYTSGLDKKYVLIDDIDLDVAPYNTGEGWVPIGALAPFFTGALDGAGRHVDKLYINRAGNNNALFGIVRTKVINVAVTNGRVIGGGRRGALLVGEVFPFPGEEVHIYNFLGHGTVYSSERVGGVVGQINDKGKIVDLMAVVTATSGDTGGGVVERLAGSGATFLNLLSLGKVVAPVEGGGIGAYISGVLSSYYNTTTSGQSDTGKGMGRTTAQLLGMGAKGPEWEAGTYYRGDTAYVGNIVYRCNVASTAQEPPHADWVVTDAWDTSIWEFKPDRYPIQRIFGEQAVHRAPPLQPTATIDGGNIVLDWDDAPSEVDLPDGYFVYQSIDNGAWTKLNATAVTAKTYTVTSPAIGEHNYFIAAFYDDAAYKIKETGNSQTVTETIA